MELQSINLFEDITIESNDRSLSTNNNQLGDVDSLSLKGQKTLRYTQDTKYRKILAHWVMWVVSIWLGLTLFVVTFNKLFCFNLDDSVCIVLLGTTTVNILGLAYIVLKGIFPNKEKE